MPVSITGQVYALAESQHGYFTSAQAKAGGLRPNTLVAMARRGVTERVSRGVYRLASYPVFPHGAYMEAVLWPQRGVTGVISHQSALAFHGLSDVSPATIHLTVRPEHRVRRGIPHHLTLHYAVLEDGDVDVLDGIPVTTPVRSILDASAAHLSRSLIRQAIEDGRRTGKLLEREATHLAARLGDGSRDDQTPRKAMKTGPR